MSEAIAASAGQRRDFVVVSIVFLPSVLPTILRGFEIPEPRQLVTAGIIVFAYGTAAAAGSYGFSRLAGRIPAGRLILDGSVVSVVLARSLRYTGDSESRAKP